MKEEYISLVKYAVNDIRFGEVYLELQSILLGKAITLDNKILVYRDVTTFEKENKIIKERESSAFRYPQLWEYSAQEKERRYTNFKDGISSTLMQTSFTQEDFDLSTIDIALKTYISKRLGNTHPLRRLTIIKKMFYHLPRKIQRWILRTIMSNVCGISDFDSKELAITNEMKIIYKVISYK